MHLSMVCMLKRASSEVRKCWPAGADKGLTFVGYNLTLAYHRTYLLVRYGRWWAPSKFDPVQSPMLLFQNGIPVIPPLTPPLGMELALKHMLMYIENLVGPERLLFFCMESPRHFEGGDWDAGGLYRREQPLLIEEVGELFLVERNGTNVESRLVQHLFEALKGSRFHILNITSMSVFRADAHPSITGGKKHEDCLHWCHPGLLDIWNDLMISL
ncbi:protein trichome birefringence-like 13 [Carex rostrata]